MELEWLEIVSSSKLSNFAVFELLFLFSKSLDLRLFPLRWWKDDSEVRLSFSTVGVPGHDDTWIPPEFVAVIPVIKDIFSRFALIRS